MKTYVHVPILCTFITLTTPFVSRLLIALNQQMSARNLICVNGESSSPTTTGIVWLSTSSLVFTHQFVQYSTLRRIMIAPSMRKLHIFAVLITWDNYNHGVIYDKVKNTASSN